MENDHADGRTAVLNNDPGMNISTGKCGCDCTHCPTYKENLKTREDRQRCSSGWKQYLDIKLSPEKLRACDGCSVPDAGRKVYYLNCIIRKCAMINEIANCEYCSGFPCMELMKVHSLQSITGREEYIRQKGKEISEKDYMLLIDPYAGLARLKKIRETLTEKDIKDFRRFSLKTRFAPLDGAGRNESVKKIYSLLTAMNQSSAIKPFRNCPPLDGYHCQSNSLAKIYHHNGHPLSEDMILGLGAGMGFIYWKMNMDAGTFVFIGGRGNNKEFFNDLGTRTGVRITTVSTASEKKAEAMLLEKLKREEPVMLFGDMGYLPWFHFPTEYHFGGHTFVVCGYDGKNTLLASDMDQIATGLKKGFYSTITLEQLRKARNSTFKPFPPKNAYLEFDFSRYHQPEKDDIFSAILQTADSQLNPPIKNLGIKGIRHTAKELPKWPGMFDDKDLRMNLFTIYIFIEIGGTGGGCFRYMYSRFLKESAAITKNEKLLKASENFQKSGEMFTRAGLLFRDAEKTKDLRERIKAASDIFQKIADLEEEAYLEFTTIKVQ